MLRNLLSGSIVLLLSISCSLAQIVSIEESAPFDRWKEGSAKIIQLRNGNTALLHYYSKTGLHVTLYRSKREVIMSSDVLSKLVPPKEELIFKGAFEITENIIVFFERTERNDKRSLLRLQIDGKNGKLLAEESIHTVSYHYPFPSTSTGDGYLLNLRIFNGYFTVRKDELSDNYAVAMLSTEKDTHLARVEIVHYGKDHKEISHVNVIPEDGYESMLVYDINVLGNSNVYVCFMAYPLKTNPKSAQLFVGDVSRGKNTARIKAIELVKDKELAICKLLYNPGEKNLILYSQLVTKSYGSTVYYTTYLTLLDPSNLGTVFHKSIETPGTNDSYKAILKKRDFKGIPQAIYINSDETYTIIFQEVTFGNVAFLDHAAIVVYNKELKEINSCMVPMRQITTHYQVSWQRYVAQSNFNPVTIWYNSSECAGVSYVDTPTGKYIFLNDLIQNQDRIARGYVSVVKDLRESDAYVCSLGNNKVEKSLLFSASKGHNYAMFSGNDFNRETGWLAMLKHEKGNMLKMVWIKLK